MDSSRFLPHRSTVTTFSPQTVKLCRALRGRGEDTSVGVRLSDACQGPEGVLGMLMPPVSLDHCRRSRQHRHTSPRTSRDSNRSSAASRIVSAGGATACLVALWSTRVAMAYVSRSRASSRMPAFASRLSRHRGALGSDGSTAIRGRWSRAAAMGRGDATALELLGNAVRRYHAGPNDVSTPLMLSNSDWKRRLGPGGRWRRALGHQPFVEVSSLIPGSKHRATDDR